MSMRAAPYKYFLLVVDMFFVLLCYMLAMSLRFGQVRWHELFPSVFLPLAAGFIFQYNDLYKLNVFLDRSASTMLVIKSLLALALVYVLGAFISNFVWVIPSRLAFVYFISMLAFVFAVYRVWLLPIMFKRLSSSGIYKRRVIIVGAGESAQGFALALSRKGELGIQTIGFVDDSVPVGTGILNGYKVVGDTVSLDHLVKMHDCDEIVIAQDHMSHEELVSMISRAKNTGATVKVVSELVRSISDATITEAYTIHPTATVTRGLYSPITFLYQRVSDVILASVGLLFLSPFFLVAAAFIKLTSKGPVFYLHERIGRNGIPFKMFKFRSMYHAGTKDSARETMMLDFMRNGRNGGNDSGKVIDESRVTPFGRFMRRTSFDELPQLINVVLGDMSLVGPRPALRYEYEAMKGWQRQRVLALPGCTGFWQVYGRGKSSFDEMVVMDIYMIENMSPWLYIQLILKTLPVLFFAKGAK